MIPKRLMKTVTGALFFLMVAAENGPAPYEGGGAIHGKVEDSGTKRGIDGARVIVNLGLEIRTAVTDTSGTFSLLNLPEGTGIPVTVEKEGYRSITAAVTAISGKSVPLAVTLSDAFLELLSFHGGRYIAGTDVEIRWEAVGIGTVRIEFSPNGGRAWLLLAEGVDSRRGFWLWPIPDMPTTNGLIRITASGRTGLADRSGKPFSITPI
ncbi:MAG: carboxypeptidase regulatory-like domain-containing protein [Candidatus Latescibacterota bacterium]